MLNTEKLCMGCMKELADSQVCAVCGFDEANYKEEKAIKLRHILADRYIVGKLVSSNGEGLTYLGYDKIENRIVRIREYFPTPIASRNEDNIKVLNENEELFSKGKLKFIELYKKLATVSDGASFFRILDIFETGGTVYCVSEYLPGITLKEFLIRNGGMLKWEQIRPLFLPLINAISDLHEVGIVHGGISPETLIVGRDGKIRLTDFAIPESRTVGGKMTAHLFPGFAAIEQYQSGEITPATDVYSFAATIFRTLTGNPPAEATARLEKDNLAFSKAVAETLPKGVLVALANALRLSPDDRTASMEAFREDISSFEMTILEEKEALLKQKEPQKPQSTKKYTVIAAIVTALVLAVLAIIVYFATQKEPEEPNTSSTLSLPSVVSVGDIGNSSKPDPLFSVPDFTNKTFAEVAANDEYKKWFVFTVEKKEYNDTVPKGKICNQSLAVGTSAKRDTEIKLTISLGPAEVTFPAKLKGMSRDKAYVTLLEMGFDPSQIEFVAKMGETATEEEVIIEALPSLGSKISPDSSVILYYNANIITDDETSSVDTESVE